MSREDEPLSEIEAWTIYKANRYMPMILDDHGLMAVAREAERRAVLRTLREVRVALSRLRGAETVDSVIDWMLERAEKGPSNG